MMETKKKIPGIDATRTVLNLLIVLYHAGFPSMAAKASSFDLRAQGWLHTIEFVLPSLFCLSGYLMMRGFSMETYHRKFMNRIKRLAVPLYAINWAILLGVTVCACLGLVHNPKYNLSWGISRFLCIAPGCGFTPLWYLRTLLIYTLAAPVFYLLIRTKSSRILALTAVAIWCCFEQSSELVRSKLGWYVPGFSLLCFLIGCVLSRCTDDLCAFARRFAVPIVLAWIGSVVFLQFVYDWSHNGILLALQCLFWFVFAHSFAKLERFRIFALLSECAFFIYVFHVDVQWNVLGRLIRPTWNMLPPSITHLTGALALAHLSCFLADLVVCVLLYLTLRRIWPFCARTLNGRL